ncbi:ATM interactor-like [Anneissia japonica]|uniref:ATM interactor-like n=1 Tax=Anneissia japonica TaxID=1529436 RepID=UPI0014256DC2|nr:ATM interactor-like [Anneissia japonica]
MDTVEVIIPSVEELSRQPETNVPCPAEGCDMVFQTRSSQRMHVVKTHGLIQDQSEGVLYGHGGKQKGKRKLYYCPVKDCNRAQSVQKPFHRRHSLRQHYFICHGEKTFICSKCGRGFGTANIKKRHETTCGQIFHCTCQCPFTSRESLLMHAKRQGHTLPVQYQRLPLPKKQKPNQQVLMKVPPKSAPDQPNGLPRKPNFILPKPTIMTVSKAALLHPENTTLVTVNNGVITDIKEIRPVQISQRPSFTTSVKLNIKDVLCKKPSESRPELSNTQAQWSAIDTQTVDWRQDNSTNTHINENVADQQVQVLPEMLTVGTNFPGVPETDAHTQTNMQQTSNRDMSCTQSNSQMQVMNISNTMSNALVQTMPLIHVDDLTSSPCSGSGQNMETQTSSYLLLQAMTEMLQRQDANQQPPVIISTASHSVHNQHQLHTSSFRHFGGKLTVSQTAPRRHPVKVVPSSRASSQTQTHNPMNQTTAPQDLNYVSSTNNILADQRSFHGGRHGNPPKISRESSLQQLSSPNTGPSIDTQSALSQKHSKNLAFREYDQRDENLTSLQEEEKNDSNDEHDYLSSLDLRSCSAEPHQNVASTVEESQLFSGLSNCTETNTIGIQAENNIHENNDHNDFSSIDHLMDTFSDFGDVFLESIATQTFMEGTSQKELTATALPEVSSAECSGGFSADSWTPASIQKSFMGESFEDLLFADSGSQTDEFPEFIFGNSFKISYFENTSKTILPTATETNKENGALTDSATAEHSLEQVVNGFTDLDVRPIEDSRTHELCDVNIPERSSSLEEHKSCETETSHKSPDNDYGEVSGNVSEVSGSASDVNTSVELVHLKNLAVDEASVNKDGNDSDKSLQSSVENPDKRCSQLASAGGLIIEKEVNIPVPGFSDVETQADIYPLKRIRLSAVMSNNETQTKQDTLATSSDKVVPAEGRQVKSNIVLTASSLQQMQEPPVPPGSDGTHISKKNTSETFQNVERSTARNEERRDVTKYCNAEIQADIIVNVTRHQKEDVTGTSITETTSVLDQTQNPLDRDT